MRAGPWHFTSVLLGFPRKAVLWKKFTADLRTFTADRPAGIHGGSAEIHGGSAEIHGGSAGTHGGSTWVHRRSARIYRRSARIHRRPVLVLALLVRIRHKDANKYRQTKSGFKKRPVPFAAPRCGALRSPSAPLAPSLASPPLVIVAWLAACSVACLFFFCRCGEEEGAVGVSHKRPRAIAPSGNDEKRRRMSLPTASLPHATCAVTARP